MRCFPKLSLIFYLSATHFSNEHFTLIKSQFHSWCLNHVCISESETIQTASLLSTAETTSAASVSQQRFVAVFVSVPPHFPSQGRGVQLDPSCTDVTA